MAQNTFGFIYEAADGSEKTSFVELKRPTIRTTKELIANEAEEKKHAEAFDANYADIIKFLNAKSDKQLEMLNTESDLEAWIAEYPAKLQNYKTSSLFRAFRSIVKPASVKPEIAEMFTDDVDSELWELQEIDKIKEAFNSFRKRLEA